MNYVVRRHIDIVTVYRTIKAFAETSEVLETERVDCIVFTILLRTEDSACVATRQVLPSLDHIGAHKCGFETKLCL
jgi:hypothetical protein